MKKAIRRILLSILIVLMLGIQTLAPCLAEGADLLFYDDAVARLGSISLTDSGELDLLHRSFAAIGSRYFAPQYRYLTEALLGLSGNGAADLTRIEITLTVLKSNGAFVEDYMSNANLAFLPLDALLAYVQARKLEADGKPEEAYQAYIKNQILDSIDRAVDIQLALGGPPAPAPDEDEAVLAVLQAEYDAYQADAEAALAALQEELCACQAALAESQSQMDSEAASEISTLKGKLLYAEGRVSLLETQLAFSEDKLAATQAALAEALATIDALNALVEELQAD